MMDHGIMNASYEQVPFSSSELAAGSMAMAAVALVAFLAFQSVSRPGDVPLSGSPSDATRQPEKAPQVPDVSPTSDSAPDNRASPAPARPNETPADFLPNTAAMMKPPALAMTDQPTRLIGLLDLFQMRGFGAASPKPEEEVPTPRGAIRDPSSLSDALWVQTRLRDLGYYSGSISGVWGPASRRALFDFKTMNGLPDGDRWDRETEQALSSRHSVHASSTFIGIWAKSIETCHAGRGIPLVIRPRGAKTDGGKCDFHAVKRETATTWQIQANCSAEERVWRANISLKLTASSLHWTSERGAETYVRCPKP
jgi:hypothetical protein